MSSVGELSEGMSPTWHQELKHVLGGTDGRQWLCLGRTSLESRYQKLTLFSETIILLLLNLGTTLLGTFFCVAIFSVTFDTVVTSIIASLSRMRHLRVNQL